MQGRFAGKEYKMEKHIIDEKTGISYTLCGDYYLPDLEIQEQEEAHYGKYGMLRKSFLKEHRPGRYSSYLLIGKLVSHLNEVDRQAHERMEVLVRQMIEKYKLNTRFLEKHLCQECLEKVAGSLQYWKKENEKKEPIPLCLIDFDTLEVYSLQDYYRSYFIRDYYVEMDLDQNEVEIEVFYLPENNYRNKSND